MKLLALLCLVKFVHSNLLRDAFVRELNEEIPNGQWVAGTVFESSNDMFPLLGLWPDLRTEDEKSYRPGSLEALENYQGTTI